MIVRALVDLVAQFSFGRNAETELDRAFYLQCLNLANMELWQITVNAKQVFETKDLFFAEGESKIDLPEGFYIKGLFSNSMELKKCEFNKLFNIPTNQYLIVDNQIWTNTSAFLAKADPDDENDVKRYITAVIVPNAKTLVENVEDEDAQTDKPIYPEPYHLGLVHGALYYSYISNKGFTEKIKYQAINWDNAKKTLADYYYR